MSVNRFDLGQVDLQTLATVLKVSVPGDQQIIIVLMPVTEHQTMPGRKLKRALNALGHWPEVRLRAVTPIGTSTHATLPSEMYEPDTSIVVLTSSLEMPTHSRQDRVMELMPSALSRPGKCGTLVTAYVPVETTYER